MRHLLCLICVIGLSAAPALAGDGHVSHHSLAKMGLSGMRVMSDGQGMQIRGTSVAVATGSSFATISGLGGSAHSTNSYSAAGANVAFGNNLSYATDTTTTTHVGVTITSTTTTNFIAAGGSSSAFAH
jgi:hypothetical protein